MAKKETIRDVAGRVIGTIETQSNGDKIVRSFSGAILGYYRKSTNVTTDSSYKVIARGDCTGMLFR